MHHRDGGPDPTELLDSAQPVIHRPTGACHTSRHHPSQPVMGGGLAAHEHGPDVQKNQKRRDRGERHNHGNQD